MQLETRKIKAIETHYKGYRFRSRLEARWAVFFDHMGIEYQYEPEGFDFNGVWYLPDFYLPQVEMYAEVKPIKLSDEESTKCELLATYCAPCLALIGEPDFHPYDAYEYGGHGDAEVVLIDHVLTSEYLDENRFFSSTGGGIYIGEDDFPNDYIAAVCASRAARFERKEKPCNLIPRNSTPFL